MSEIDGKCVENDKKLSFWPVIGCKCVIGAVSGVVGTAVSYPLAFIKYQVQSAGSPFTGPIDCIQKTWAANGLRGFYVGMKPNLLFVAPEKSIKLVVNEFLKDHWTNEKGEVPFMYQLFAGAGAGISQGIVTNPMEILTLRMSQDAGRRSLSQIMLSMKPSEFYTGWRATFARDLPFSIIMFPGYTFLKEKFADSEGKNSVLSNLAAGFIAGATGAALVTPADVVKTRLQQEKGKGYAYKGVFDGLATIYRTEGMKVLFRGAELRMISVGPLFGITLLSFEWLKEKMTKEGYI